MPTRLPQARQEQIHDTPMVEYDYKAFAAGLGRRVKQLRKERGWTLRDLVVEHGLHLTQVSRVESGKGISVPTLLRLAEVFQMPVEQLVADLGHVDAGDRPSNPSKI